MWYRALRNSCWLLLAVVLIGALNTHAQAQKPREDARDWVWNDPKEVDIPGILHHTIESRSMGRTVGYCVYLPPQYAKESDRRFPVVYFLHGSGGTETSDAGFARLVDAEIKAGRIAPCIYVFPNGGKRSGYRDWKEGNVRSETLIMKELIPRIDAEFRTIANGKERAICGFSMGGGGALRLAFKYPNEFCAAASLAAAIDKNVEGHGGENVYAYLNQNGDVIKTSVAVSMVVGEKDFLAKRHPSFVARLKELEVQYSYRVLEGVDHNLGKYTKLAGVEMIQFLAKQLPQATRVTTTVAQARDSITQYGITWAFTRAVPAGQFVTGDWWVVGPVTIASVTPTPTADRHGSVVNPPAGDVQGYDARIAGFDTSLRAEFPLHLKPGESLVSVASVDAIGEKTAATVRGQYCRGPLRTAVVLTCLKEIPPLDAFRPAYVGTWKERFTASQLRRDALPQLKAPENVPEIAAYERALERIWLDHMRQWVNRKMHPLENMPDYGREITNIVSDVALLLLLKDPDQERETLLLRYVQKGIDYYGVTRSDNNLWIANGGHNSGRKWPILFAGMMLGHEAMMNADATFQEDQQTYHGEGFHGQTALWTISPSNPNRCHEEVDPETWKTFGDTKGNNGLKAEAYRQLNGPTWVGQALAVRLTGMVDCWSHPPYFDYVDRWCDETQSANAFVWSMWTMYRDKADGIGADVPRK